MSISQQTVQALLRDEHVTILTEEEIKKLSHGAVTNDETINTRTGGPERGGIFCCKIFGPIYNGCCLCAKYHQKEHTGIICEKCGVEVGPSSLRAERVGHIALAAPIPHPLLLHIIEEQLGIEANTLTALLSGERVLLKKDQLQALSYQEWFTSTNREEPLDPGTTLRELLEARELDTTKEGGRWLAARRLKLSDLMLSSLPVVPPGLRPIEWKKKPNVNLPPDHAFDLHHYLDLPATVAQQLKEKNLLIYRHEPASLGLNHRYQNLIRQNEQLASCIKYEAPTSILLREYAALFHCVHSFFWVGKDSLVKFFLSKQDTEAEEIALSGLALRRNK